MFCNSVLQHLDISPKEESKSFLTFVIPHEKEKLLKVNKTCRYLSN